MERKGRGKEEEGKREMRQEEEDGDRKRSRRLDGYRDTVPYGCWGHTVQGTLGEGRGLWVVAVLTCPASCLSQRSLPACRTCSVSCLLPAGHWLLPAAGGLLPACLLPHPRGQGELWAERGLPGTGLSGDHGGVK